MLLLLLLLLVLMELAGFVFLHCTTLSNQYPFLYVLLIGLILNCGFKLIFVISFLMSALLMETVKLGSTVSPAHLGLQALGV